LRTRAHFALLLSLLAVACGGTGGDAQPQAQDSATGGEATVTQEPFGATPQGEAVTLFTLTNAQGMEVRAMTYGGIILSLKVPDRHGEMGDVVLGYDDLEGYLEETPYFGAIIGRYGNRIGGARFELDGTTYELAANDGVNHLHGGLVGFDKVVWDAEPFQNDEGIGILFSRTSPDGEEGYPGNLSIEVRYTLTDENVLIFDYLATTDAPTPVNLTQHSYFNLGGHASGDILGHKVSIHASEFTPVDMGLIPTGELAPVGGTPFDFRELGAIGEQIDADHEQIRFGGGFDHNFVLSEIPASFGDDRPSSLAGLTPAVQVVEPTTGRIIEVYTTEPGLQFYSGNFLNGTITGKEGAVYEYRNGFCLETQHFPDSPNQPAFSSTILRPGEEYRSRTAYVFSVSKAPQGPAGGG